MRYRAAFVTQITVAFVVATSGGAQQPGGMGPMGMMGGMGMRHDSTAMALMMVIHELVMSHDRITRTVTNLPNGIRAVTESDDPRLTRLIQEHVATMDLRLSKGDDPGLPPESPAVHSLFRDHDKLLTTTLKTPKGVVVEQTSGDSTVVAALQQHAREVSDLVKDGMAAMHAAMMKSAKPD